MNAADSTIDLEAYFARIGYTGERQPTAAVLQAIHLAHATHIPFENLDVLLGRPIDLSPEGIRRKLVTDRRGAVSPDPCVRQLPVTPAVRTLHALFWPGFPRSVRSSNRSCTP